MTSRSRKVTGWVIGKRNKTPKFDTILLFSRSEGILPIKVRLPKQMRTAQVPVPMSLISAEVYAAGGVQDILVSYTPLSMPNWEQLGYERLHLGAIFMEMITALLPLHMMHEHVFDEFVSLIEYVASTEDLRKLRTSGMYRLLFAIGGFSCGSLCPRCHTTLDTKRCGFLQDSLEIVCSTCSTSGCILVDGLAVRWMRAMEKYTLEEALKIQGNPALLQQIDTIIHAVLQQSTGRPLRTLTYS